MEAKNQPLQCGEKTKNPNLGVMPKLLISWNPEPVDRQDIDWMV